MKKTRILLALIVVLALCLSLVPLALASGTPEYYTEAAITKKLLVPVGTEYPAMSFVFSITPESYNESSAPADLLKLPVIGTQVGTTGVGEVTIAFDGERATPRAETFEATIGAVSTYYLESADIFAGIAFPNAGIYTYIIEEARTNYTIVDPLHEALETSIAKYEVSVMIREDDDGVPYIFHIGAYRIITEDGDPGTDKVDPTPGGNQTTTFYSQMTFENRYVRTNGADDPDDPDPGDPDPGDPDPLDPDAGDSTFNLSKVVMGDLGSHSLPFQFSLQIDVPKLIPGYVLGYYKAYLVDSTGVLDPAIIDGLPSTMIDVDTTSNGYSYIKFPDNTAVNIQLTHGQSLVFINTPVGTAFSATETAETGYDTSVTIWNNSVLTSTAASLTAAGYVGELFNAAIYVNDAGDVTPGGVNVNDLPFYGLILLAVGGLVLFIVVKARKRNRG